MGSDIGRGGICGQVLLVIINIIFIVLGIIALALGAWAIANGNTFGFVTNNLIGGSAILIIIGGVVVIIATVGIIGAIFKLRPFLVVYAIVVLACIILEIIAGILVIVFRNDVSDIFQRFARDDVIAEYDPADTNSDINIFVNFVQSTFSCCGVINASDWSDLNVDAITDNNGRPPSCLNCTIGVDENCASFDYVVEFPTLGMNLTRNFTTTDVGCASVSTTALLAAAIGAGAVGIVFAILEIIGIIVALLLCCCIQRARKQTVV